MKAAIIVLVALALLGCVETMAKGMPSYQGMDLSGGLATMQDMNEYCYYVAGCVGEMLAKLFCHYSPEINQHSEQLLALSTSFGQGRFIDKTSELGLQISAGQVTCIDYNSVQCHTLIKQTRNCRHAKRLQSSFRLDALFNIHNVYVQA